MKKQTKNIINKFVKYNLFIGIFILSLSFILLCANLGFGIKLNPPYCWASFFQLGIFLIVAWAFNKELFYY
jgi:phosphoglycerol transferase MdoB-like AlkP superfamily enzyme